MIAALAWGVFSFGAVYPWGYWPLAAACAAVGVACILTTHPWEDPRLRKLAVACGVVALAIAVQLVALPYSLVQGLSPSFDRFFSAYAVSYHPAALHPLSIAPQSTVVALALFVALSVLLIGLIAALRVMSLEWLLNQVMGLGLALALVGVVQRAVATDPHRPMVYGFWEPLQGGNPFGPFINRNHFAGWMVMALPLVAGYSAAVLAQTWRPTSSRWSDRVRWLTTVEASRFLLVSFCALLMGMALALTGSRSGIASFAIALLTFGYFTVKYFKARRARLLFVAYLAVILIGAVGWAGTDLAIGRFAQVRVDSSGRWMAWQDTLRIFGDFPWFGTGLGTYGQAMLVYQTASRPRIYVQAHNEYLQLLAEGGLAVAVPALVVAALIVLGIRRRLAAGTDDPLTYWVRAGAVAGLVGIAAQSIVDFSLQIPGNTVLFVMLLAIALHRGPVDVRHRVRVPHRHGTGRHARRI